MLDEHGMPVPSVLTALPVRIADMMSECEQFSHGKIIVDSSENENEVVGLYAFGSEEDMEYFVHAANWIIPCREIVRRLSVWYHQAGTPGGSVSFNVIEVSRDAANLWDKMQEEAKGGDQ